VHIDRLITCRRQSVCAAAFLLALGLIAAGCRHPAADGDGGPGDPSPMRSPDTIVVGYSTDMTSVNELISPNTALHTALHYFMLFMPLLKEQPDFATGPPTWKPLLARSWRFSDDRRQLTFELRPDAVWSDGEPITADDVYWTWQAQIHPAVAWGSAVIKRHIVDVEVLDPHTVRVYFDRPYANQLIDVAGSGVVLPRHAWSALPFEQWRANPQWFADHLVTSGPLTLERWQPGERIVLRRNERYFAGDPPSYERLVLLVIPDENTRLAHLRRGDVHLIEVMPASAARLAGEPAITIERYPTRQIVFIAWNHLRPPFDDPRVRRALTMAINRQQIIDTLYHGYALPTATWYGNDTWLSHGDLQPLPYDPQAARQLLAEAGFADDDGDGILERDGRPFRFELLTNEDNQTRGDIMVMVQEQLKKVGVAVDTQLLEFNTLVARELAHQYDAAVSSYGIDTSFDLSGILHSKATRTLNVMSYSNPEVDRLLEEIQAAIDPLATKPLHLRLQELVHRDQPATLLYQPQRLIAYRGLSNVEPTPLSVFWNVASWRLEPEP